MALGMHYQAPIAELVPGDIVRPNAGDLVPADARWLDVKAKSWFDRRHTLL
jgi:magnesium-transporting ATPase (P-type)